MTETDLQDLVMKLQAKCVACKNKWILAEQEIRDAQTLGCAMCSKCGSPATVEKVTLKRGLQ